MINCKKKKNIIKFHWHDFSLPPKYSIMKMDLKNSRYKGSKSNMFLPFKLTNHWGRKLTAKWNSSDVALFYCYEVTDYKHLSSILWKVLGKQGDEVAGRFKVDFKLDKVRQVNFSFFFQA